MYKLTLVCVGMVCLIACSALAYGPLGHEIIGAVADERLAGSPEGGRVTTLLDGMSLEKAAVIADEIRGWDKKGVDDPKSFHYSVHPKIDRQLRDFWRANPPTHDLNSAIPSHHWFHYTDVPLVPPQNYGDGNYGRRKWDVVHIIGYCVDVLRGRIPEDNARKITKTVAVILLSHYVGDIHQPLHVGAEYFDQQGHPADPAHVKSPLPDEGGNTLVLRLADDGVAGHPFHTRSLHGFWDLDAVNTLLPVPPETLSKTERRTATDRAKKALAHEMAAHAPNNWQMPEGVDLHQYAEIWADEIIPVARQAHDPLTFRNIKPMLNEDGIVATGEADEVSGPDHMSYREWALKVVRQELHKAGWRLADLLQKIIASARTNERIVRELVRPSVTPYGDSTFSHFF
jgi:hypothetical protein